jgi:hypothetical protein
MGKCYPILSDSGIINSWRAERKRWRRDLLVMRLRCFVFFKCSVEVSVKRENYVKYGNLQISGIALLYGVVLLIASAKYFSNSINVNEGRLPRNIFGALIILAAVIFSSVYRGHLQRKKNKIAFNEVKEELSPNITSYIYYLKSTYLWRLTIYAILGIPLVLLGPWLAARGVGNSPTIFLYFAMVGIGIVLVTVPLIIYFLVKK